jgi:hypothetical protein
MPSKQINRSEQAYGRREQQYERHSLAMELKPKKEQ